MYYRRDRGGFPPRPPGLLQQRADELGEAVAGSIEAALHRTQIAAGDVRDLGVALPLELAQHEHGAVMGRQLAHALVHRLFQIALAVQVVGARRGVLELERPVVGLPVLLDRLEQDQRVAAAIAQLVLTQVRGDRVDPRRELLGLIEPVEVAEHADEHLLHEVLSPFAVADRPVDEVEQAGLVAVDQGPERANRKSTRLNSSHGYISYAVFCLKKKTTTNT